MRSRVLFALLVLVLCLLIPLMADSMNNRPVEVKLGYLPHPQVLKVLVADHGPLVAEFAVVKVLFYLGTIIDHLSENVIVQPEYFNMFKTLQTAARLDPYNVDIYYFAQAIFTWELGRVKEVNNLLKYGMKYRTRDYWLPFYLGFNNAYFLKDYEQGALYMQRAAEISGNTLFAKLAARYFYESEQTTLGLTFLDSMIANAKDKAVKKTYQIRRDALLAVNSIEEALHRFFEQTGRAAVSLDELLAEGLMDGLPDDPYGGNFYLDQTGRVRSTSKFANPDL